MSRQQAIALGFKHSAFDSAVRKDPDHREAIIAALQRLGRRRRLGSSALLEIATREQLGQTMSPLESRVRIVIRRNRVPPPVPQLAVCDRNCDQIGVFDFAWPDKGVIIFVDSWDHHSARDPFEKDRRQMSALAALGWRILPVTSRRLDTDEAGFVDELRQALATGKPITM